jgi:type I restriction enzyme, S subunit
MELRDGYRPTDVGTLPSDWELVPLAQLFEFRNGVNADKAAYGTGVRFINVLEVITKSHLRASDVPGRISLPREWLVPYAVLKGDVVFNRTSETQEEVGLAAVYEDDEEVVFGGFVIRGRPRDSTALDARYSGYALRSAPVRQQMIARGQGAIRANIGQQDLRSVLLPLPTVRREQEAIAAALADVDALLDAQDRLITKKRDLKQAAMQQLLTGQTRLSGFSDDWADTTLGALGSWLSGGTPSKSNEALWDGTIPWVSPKDMKVPRIRDAIDHVATAALGNGTRLLPAGAVLIVVRGMILAHSAPIARAERPVAFNQDIKGLVVGPDVDSDFVLWWLEAHEALLLGLTNESTHGTKRIPTDELLKVKLRLPPPAEQSAIAKVITEMDAELAALKRQCDKTRLLKQGMMQELLSGRTRLA